MQCPDCGAYIGDEDSFCGECGRPVQRAPAARADLAGGADEQRTVARVPPAVARPPSRPVAAPAAPAAPSRARRGGIILGLLATGVAMIVMCVAIGLIFLAFRSDDEPTPTPERVVPTPAATPTPFQPLKSEPVAPTHVEDFDIDDGGWDVYDEQDTWAAYVDGGYRLGVRRAQYVTWANPTWDESFANFEVEVDTRQVEGPIDNNLGVLVRYQADGENYYWFQISNDGFYSVSMLRDGDWQTLADWQASDAIETGLDVVNHVRVVCMGDEFDLYVNDTYLTTVVDDTFATGNVGLAAGTFDEPGVVIEFDNLAIRVLDE